MKTPDVLSKLATRKFIQIPGPNPILVPGEADEWDGSAIETGGVIKDADTYYLYYHGWAADPEKWRGGYRIGVATAKHPLGPWKKHEANPIIDLGEEGSWDGSWIACPAILKEDQNRYYMYYSGDSKVGLATAEHPAGPWKKHDANPIIDEDFGYVGAVIKVGDTYMMYHEHPIDRSPDQGPFALATARSPEGPWQRCEESPVLEPDSYSAWDSGGYSESGVLYHDGVYHTFYAGTKWERQPTDWKSAFESIGYAVSLDGRSFVRHVDNPVVPRERNPDVSALSEIHTLWEAPYYYLFHTLRYISFDVREGYGEYIGVQVLATEKPFRLSMPVISLDTLGPGEITPLHHTANERKRLQPTGCPPISLERVSSVSITAECGYESGAKAAARILVKSSCDGELFDTHDAASFDMPIEPGELVRATVKLDLSAMYIKVQLENPDDGCAISDIVVQVTLGT